MTSHPTVLLGLLNLALIGALPRIFFRPGRLNLQWWVTASPFMIGAGTLLAMGSGAATPVLAPRPLLEGAAVALHAGSVYLIGFTLGTHREPLSLWHQPDDAPRHLVSHGAYARVRHPFYSAFLLALAGAALSSPHWATAAAFAFGCVQLNRTAAREERMLLGSAFGSEYRAYIGRTGRFFPFRSHG